MKIILLYSLLLANLGFSQNSNIKIHSCETKALYILKENQFHFENKLFRIKQQDTIISQIDQEKINKLVEKLVENPNNEAWVNSCVLDGINLKVFIENGNINKKIFIGNYFEKNLNEIALILNSYIKNDKSGFIIKIPYGITDKKEIEEEIKLQLDCDEMSEENKKSLLNNWCEPYK